MNKSHKMLVLGVIAGSIGTFLLIRSGIISAQVQLGYTGPYHNYGPAMAGGIPKQGWVPSSAISGAARVF